jgi:hypothetical protein
MTNSLTKKKLVKLQDTGNKNQTIAERTGRFSYIFPLRDKDGNEITEEQASRKGTKNTAKVHKNA